MSETDLIVLRAAPGMPVDGMGDREGRWMDRSTIPLLLDEEEPDPNGPTVSTAIATATGRFEVREDGAVAEVWEVRW